MKKTAYTYSLINSQRQKDGVIQWIRIWFKKAATKYKYKYHPIILTYTNNVGFYIEKKFRSFQALKEYLSGGLQCS